MPVEFATVARKASSPLARVPLNGGERRASNENHRTPSDDERVLEAALRHFAVHGLGSAGAAFGEAERALAIGDVELARHWQLVCSAFDRRMGVRLQQRIDAPTRSLTNAF